MSKKDVKLLASYLQSRWTELHRELGLEGCNVDVDLVHASRPFYVATVRLDGDSEAAREVELDPFLAARNVFATVRSRLERRGRSGR